LVERMDKAEAHRVLAAEVTRLRAVSYAELSARIPRRRRRILFIEQVGEDQARTHEVVGESRERRTRFRPMSSGRARRTTTSESSWASTMCRTTAGHQKMALRHDL